MGDFRQLTAYERAVDLADALREAIIEWPSFDRWTLGVQLVRSADSIGANIAEGYGRASDRDQCRFLVVARGSATETEHWVERAVARELLGDAFVDRTREVSRIVNGLVRRHLRKARTTDV
jgi:four helix bundle protein